MSELSVSQLADLRIIHEKIGPPRDSDTLVELGLVEEDRLGKCYLTKAGLKMYRDHVRCPETGNLFGERRE